jgi:beta-phosphoglucomutase family hydrolase
MTKAIIFDMDGVIVDSEPLHYESEKKILARLGYDFPRELHRKYIGYANEYNFWRDLQKEYGISLNIQTLMLEKRDYFLKHLSHITLIKPAFTLLERLTKAGVPVALASSSSMEFITAILEKFDLTHFFSVIQSGDDLKNGKPAPDIFLIAAKKINIKPEHCIVIEDSLNGVKAGHTAGMTVIAVPNEYTKMLDFSLADYQLSSLDQFYDLGLIQC